MCSFASASVVGRGQVRCVLGQLPLDPRYSSSILAGILGGVSMYQPPPADLDDSENFPPVFRMESLNGKICIPDTEPLPPFPPESGGDVLYFLSVATSSWRDFV